jgi:MFS transporter, DHA1 family, tetracycline resistance protein
LFNPAYQTLVAAESDDSDRGLVNGLTQGASSLGRVIGPGVSGGIYQNYGQAAPFTAGAAVMVIALVLAIGVRRRNT